MNPIAGLRSVELFGGAGGLALGLHRAGFSTELFVEWDRWACDTVRENAKLGFRDVADWRVHEGDVRSVDWSEVPDGIDLVSGGPPCQPFSMGGKARAADDKRDMFPAAAEVIRTLRPRAFVLENVKGLTRAAFANYLQLIQLRLRYPDVAPQPGESWLDHLARLQAAHTSTEHDLIYNVSLTVVNAADYGVPQQRQRVLIVGFRDDVDAEWSMPEATHSLDALLHAQWVTGDYWDAHKVAKRNRPAFPERQVARISALACGDLSLGDVERWRTVRDALTDVPEPQQGVSHRAWHNHTFQDGARSYPGHDGSPIDFPAKTLKAGGHGVPGGENMLRRNDGSIRYFTIRESARLQTFPDEYRLHGAWGEAMRQLGNAVPVDLARVVGDSVREHLPRASRRLRSA